MKKWPRNQEFNCCLRINLSLNCSASQIAKGFHRSWNNLYNIPALQIHEIYDHSFIINIVITILKLQDWYIKQLPSQRSDKKMDKWTSWYWKRQENSPFCVRTLSTSEKAIFWICLHSWPFGRALQLLISQEAIRVCPVPRHYFPSQAFPWGFKLYNFSSGLVTERSNLLSQPNSFVSFVSITDPGSDVKEQRIWSWLLPGFQHCLSQHCHR